LRLEKRGKKDISVTAFSTKRTPIKLSAKGERGKRFSVPSPKKERKKKFDPPQSEAFEAYSKSRSFLRSGKKGRKKKSGSRIPRSGEEKKGKKWRKG